MKNIDNNRPMFPISIVADLLQVHQRTLRIYNDEGILVPQRSMKNRRLYSMQDIETGRFIQFLSREVGINLAGIKIIFKLMERGKISISGIEETVKALGITETMLEENKIKLGKRGRKKNENK
jgi:MerR family transcriptional regulator/heat shock protein HspR